MGASLACGAIPRAVGNGMTASVSTRSRSALPSDVTTKMAGCALGYRGVPLIRANTLELEFIVTACSSVDNFG